MRIQKIQTERHMVLGAFLVALALLWPTLASAQHLQVDRWKAQGWKTDFSKTTIDFASIRSGGPPRDGIPPLDEPRFVEVNDAKAYADREPVIGLEINGDARAYPLSILMWHEIANDVVGGTPVAVTYCPLCNAAIVFDARVDGERQTFGTTGKLRKSDLVMYDRKTDSWWQQFSGEAIVGDHVGKSLKFLPARLESWGNFKARHPDGKVLVPNNPGMRNYGRNPYVGYDQAARPFLYNGEMPKNIEPMARVVVVRRADKEPLVVSLEKLRKDQPLELENYRLEWAQGQSSALGHPRIAEGRDVGNVTVFDVSEGEAKLVPYDVTFAFVAHAFHPQTAILTD